MWRALVQARASLLVFRINVFKDVNSEHANNMIFHFSLLFMPVYRKDYLKWYLFRELVRVLALF